MTGSRVCGEGAGGYWYGHGYRKRQVGVGDGAGGGGPKGRNWWAELGRALQETGCSRKVAVGRARKLDMLVCRHSRLCAGVWSGCGVGAVSWAGRWAGLGRALVARRLAAGVRSDGGRRTADSGRRTADGGGLGGRRGAEAAQRGAGWAGAGCAERLVKRWWCSRGLLLQLSGGWFRRCRASLNFWHV